MTTFIGETRMVIRETTGKNPRELVISGASMPYAPAPFGGVGQRSQITRYAGNPTASTTIFGTEEMSNTLEGRFFSRNMASNGKVFYNDGTLTDALAIDGATLPVVNAKDAYAALEDLCRGCRLLHVNWAGMERWGFMTNVTPEWKTTDEVYWTIEFEWVSRIANPDPPFIKALKKSGSESIANFNAAKTVLASAVAVLRKVFEGMDDEVMNRIADLDTAVRMAESVASLGVEEGAGALDVADRMMESAYTAARAAYNVANQARTMAIIDGASYTGWMFGQGSRHYPPPGTPTDISSAASKGGLWDGSMGAGLLASDVAGATGLGDQSYRSGALGSNRPGSVPRGYFGPDDSGQSYERLDVGDVMSSPVAQQPAKYLSLLVQRDAAVEQIMQGAFEYLQTANALRALVRPNERKIHVVQKDEDLRHISVRYYGTQGRWREIAELNGIDGSSPTTGTRLMIMP